MINILSLGCSNQNMMCKSKQEIVKNMTLQARVGSNSMMQALICLAFTSESSIVSPKVDPSFFVCSRV